MVGPSSPTPPHLTLLGSLGSGSLGGGSSVGSSLLGSCRVALVGGSSGCGGGCSQTGQVTNSIQFCCLFTVKDHWTKRVINKRTIKVSCQWDWIVLREPRA